MHQNLSWSTNTRSPCVLFPELSHLQSPLGHAFKSCGYLTCVSTTEEHLRSRNCLSAAHTQDLLPRTEYVIVIWEHKFLTTLANTSLALKKIGSGISGEKERRTVRAEGPTISKRAYLVHQYLDPDTGHFNATFSKFNRLGFSLPISCLSSSVDAKLGGVSLLLPLIGIKSVTLHSLRSFEGSPSPSYSRFITVSNFKQCFGVD